MRDLVKTASNKSKYFHDKLLFLKMIQMILFTKQKQTQRLRESTYGCQGQRMRGRDREFGINIYKLLYLKRIANKVLLYGTGDSSQCYVTVWMEGSLGENGYMSMYGWDPMLSTWNYHIVNLLYSNLKQNIFKNDKNKEGSGGTLIQQTIWI